MIVRNKTRAGFSLIEVVVSMLLVAVLLIPISNMVIASYKKNEMAQQKQKSTQIGQSLIQEFSAEDILKLSDYDSINGTATLKTLDGQILNMKYDLATESWNETSGDIIDGCNVQLNIKMNTNNISYNTNANEIQNLNDNNSYYNVLVVGDGYVDWYEQGQSQMTRHPFVKNLEQKEITIKGSDNNISSLEFKDSSTGTIYTIPNRNNVNIIKIIQDPGFDGLCDYVININSQVDFKVDLLKKKLNTNCPYQIKAYSNPTDQYKNSVEINSIFSDTETTVLNDLYDITVQVYKPNDNVHPLFKGSFTKNMKIDTN